MRRFLVPALVAFAAGVLVTTIVLAPHSAQARRELTRSRKAQAQAEALSDDFRYQWETTVGYLSDSIEPKSEVSNGVYLGRIVGTDRYSIIVDWLGVRPVNATPASPEPYRDVTNRSRFRQTLRPLATATVYTMQHDSLRRVDDIERLLAQFQSRDEAGDQLRKRYWWITVTWGGWAQLIEMP